MTRPPIQYIVTNHSDLAHQMIYIAKKYKQFTAKVETGKTGVFIITIKKYVKDE